MSTIINNLSLCNFFNYYGGYESNFYEFNPGLNVIVADNNNGKSKLFSAFSWILKNEVIDSDREKDKMVPVNNFIIRMISDKAKDETFINGDVYCGVKINYSDETFEYEVEKSAWARRIADGSATDAQNWVFGLNDTKVSKKDKYLLDFRPVTDELEKNNIVERLIRKPFLKYALFQGEEVDNILNFNDQRSLKSALDALTNISKIEKLIEKATYLAKRADKDLTDEKKKEVKQVDLFNRKVAELNDLKIKLDRKKAELSRYKDELAKAKAELDGLFNSLLNAETREQLRAEKFVFQQELDRIDNEHGEFLNNLNDKFFDVQTAWLLYNTQHYESAFQGVRDAYIESQNEKKFLRDLQKNEMIFVTKLPKDSPDSYSLRKMLKDETCFVCGREAHKDSEPWVHIKQVLEQHSVKPDQPAKQTFNAFLDSLMSSTSSFFNQVSTVEESFKENRLKDREYKQTKQRLLQRIDEKTNDLVGLGETKGDQDKLTVNRYSGAQQRVTKYENDIRNTEADVTNLTEQIQIKKAEIDELVTGKLNPLFQIRSDMMNDVLKIAVSAKKRIYDSIIKELEDQANYYYKELTKANPTDGGIIRIVANDDDTFSMDICDQYGSKTYGLSEGFQRMKKLAVITAIIRTSERGQMEYPLIADAPLSSFGKGFIQGFFDKVPEVFNQSIVMVKDLFDQTSPNLLNDIGNEVLAKIRINSGSMHINRVNNTPQILRETEINRL